ncbi:hypothetical protein HJC23_008682 [Cyclotella cryptica]|uniref:Toprim domain-containing protein n=1 Tax=Cyclotella cryptica TaxID=29204 RepID=A0ABD3QGS2_9STRA|eukprot:CCRYP_005394-RA/>CCRYP_005394-RA protein AED:0.02 eAED:0.02 QI:299/0.66/0.75/1/1/1/4/1177/1457
MSATSNFTNNVDGSIIEQFCGEFGKCFYNRRYRRTGDSFYPPKHHPVNHPSENYRRDFTAAFVTILLLSKSPTSASLLLPRRSFPLPLATRKTRVALTPGARANTLDPQRHVTMHFSKSSPLYFYNDASENDAEESIPIHEFQEENEREQGSSGNFNRQNYVRKIHISDRKRKQLSDSSSFNNHVDDEWNSFANLNFPPSDERASGDQQADFLFREGPSLNTEAADRGDIGMGSIAHNVVWETVQNGVMIPTRETSAQSDKSSESSGRDSKLDTNLSQNNLKDEIRVSTVGKKYPARSVDESSDITPSIEQPVITDNIMNEPQTRISTEQVKEIKSSISIIDVIESYNLPKFIRTNSHTAKACCPFHNDHNPSMSIDDNRGIYKCFACGAGGDLFNFIREYDSLNGRKEKMGFWEAVQFAAKEFGGEHLAAIGKFDTTSRSWKDNISDEAKAKIKDRERKKERIRLANNAAAAFYTKCLVTLPTAGKARAHLRSRKISPDSIRTFALGYAPDCYFGDETVESNQPGSETAEAWSKLRKRWGEGSLVEYLTNMGFSPNEIVEAGLAVRTNKDSANEDKYIKGKGEDYHGLMDRFRSRLVVPILDRSGRNVIGFGGRHLESTTSRNTSDDSSFTPAKYINSPESYVFTKKASLSVLFNEHNARLAIEECSTENNANGTSARTDHRRLPTIIVEGYFDVIALHNAGVKNVVASMGTALTVEQLKIAADMTESGAGRIIFCMDNDDAGRSAVERICSSNMIIKTSVLSEKDILVATLPAGIKDPSDFVDDSVKDVETKVRFESEVLQKSQPWDEWFVKQLLRKYGDDAHDGKSFPAICDQVSTFLAAFPNPADRTRRIYNIVEILFDLIVKGSEIQSSSLGMMRVQLESDLINMVSRKASVREAIERRIEKSEGLAQGSAILNKVDVITRGEGTSYDSDDDRKLSSRALAKLNRPGQRTLTERPKQVPTERLTAPRRPPQKAAYKTSRATAPKKDLIPHFSGFTFKHKTDRDWLGLSGKNKRKMYLGSPSTNDENKEMIRAESPLFGRPNKRFQRENDIVYFNSNRYIGERYLTSEAMDAGYQLGADRPSSGESLMEFTNRMLLERNANEMILQAESRLLHALAKFPQARAVMRTVYSVSTFIPPNMEWTSVERQWLFECLTGSLHPPLPKELLDGGNANQLRSILIIRDDRPPNAFIDTTHTAIEEVSPTVVTPLHQESSHGNVAWNGSDDPSEEGSDVLPPVQKKSVNCTGSVGGSLEEYFLEASHLFPSFSNNRIADETRAELTVQETVATLLRASAIKRFLSVKARLKKIVYEMDHRAESSGEQQQAFFDEEFSTTSSEELRELFERVAMEVMEAQMSLYESDRSTDRVNSHLLDYSTTNSVQYRMSQAQIERLDKLMEDHIASLPDDKHRPDVPGDDENYVFGLDAESQDIDEKYGGRDPESYVSRGLPNGESKWG